MWKKIAEGNLRVRAGERFVVLADDGPSGPEAAAAVSAELVVCPNSGGHGREPHPDVWNAVFGAAAIATLDMEHIFERLLTKSLEPADHGRLETWVNRVRPLAPRAILAITHFSTSHTAFRRLLTKCGTRYASMPLFQPYLLRENGPLDLDTERMIARTRALAERVEGARSIRITTPLGTDLSFSVAGRKFLPDDGDLSAEGAFGNLPAGEIYVAPVEGTGEGVLALTKDVRVSIRGGAVTSVTGTHAIRKIFEEHPEYLRLAELGIGTNDRASRTDNVLEAEKIMGTVHIAFGDNSSFGGVQQIPYHVDHVQYDPTVFVDGRKLELPRE